MDRCSDKYRAFKFLLITFINIYFKNVNFQIHGAFHELHENMGENLSHLVHAIEQFWSFLLHLFYSAVVGTAGFIAGNQSDLIILIKADQIKKH